MFGANQAMKGFLHRRAAMGAGTAGRSRAYKPKLVLFRAKAHKHYQRGGAMESKEQFKMIVTYDSKGRSIEDVFLNVLKQRLLSCEQLQLDSPQGEVVQYEAQDK